MIPEEKSRKCILRTYRDFSSRCRSKIRLALSRLSGLLSRSVMGLYGIYWRFVCAARNHRSLLFALCVMVDVHVELQFWEIFILLIFRKFGVFRCRLYLYFACQHESEGEVTTNLTKIGFFLSWIDLPRYLPIPTFSSGVGRAKACEC